MPRIEDGLDTLTFLSSPFPLAMYIRVSRVEEYVYIVSSLYREDSLN